MRWRGVLPLLLLVLAWLALDDVTTDNATTFVREYSILYGQRARLQDRLTTLNVELRRLTDSRHSVGRVLQSRWMA